MSQPRPPRLPNRVQQLLDDNGLKVQWVLGSRHWHLYLDGKMVMVVSLSNSRPRGDYHSTDAMISRVRRFLRERAA